tara:strand:+ start:741 stop:872 length:132 start_codon:yes stop_codon:yes gene_type:complete
MPQVEYTAANGDKHTLDLTNPTMDEIKKFYDDHIKQHDPASGE